ncbi:MAG: DUF456 domain-containing protein [Acidimicrobiales bacterium]|nr:DUF456 domain-containing protein [Acidimicrobiales bacterium]
MIEMTDTAWTLVVGLALVIGLFGVLIPILPGLGLMMVVALLYGFAVGWSTTGIVVMVIIAMLFIASVIVGLLLPKRAAAEAGATTWSIVVAAVGGIIGFFVIPVIGVVVGALVGLLLSEYHHSGDWATARASTVATAKGFGVSVLVQFTIGCVLLMVWAVWAATVIW